MEIIKYLVVLLLLRLSQCHQNDVLEEEKVEVGRNDRPFLNHKINEQVSPNFRSIILTARVKDPMVKLLDLR